VPTCLVSRISILFEVDTCYFGWALSLTEYSCSRSYWCVWRTSHQYMLFSKVINTCIWELSIISKQTKSSDSRGVHELLLHHEPHFLFLHTTSVLPMLLQLTMNPWFCVCCPHSVAARCGLTTLQWCSLTWSNVTLDIGAVLALSGGSIQVAVHSTAEQ
jgi:hypothetical protein